MMSNALYREMTSIPADLFRLDDYDETETPPILQSYFQWNVPACYWISTNLTES